MVGEDMGTIWVAHWVHANANYAEIPEGLRGAVFDSYAQLYGIIRRQRVPATLEINGETLEMLESLRPEVLRQLQELVWDKIVEINGSTYSHPFMPILNERRATQQLARYLDIHERIFGKDFLPKGVYLPEYIFQNDLYWVLRGLDYQYVLVWGDRVAQGLLGNSNWVVRQEVRLDTKKVDDPAWRGTLRPRKILGTYGGQKEDNLMGIPIHGSIVDFTRRRVKGQLWQEVDYLMENLHRRWGEDRDSLFIPAMTDQEFFEIVNGVIPGDPDLPAWTAEAYEQYLQHLKKTYGKNLVKIGDYLRLHDNSTEPAIYLPSGGDAILSTWMREPDNQLLNDGCRYLGEMIDRIGLMLRALRRQGKDIRDLQERMARLNEELMQLEGSDFRGFLPTAEKRLEGFRRLHNAQRFEEQLWKDTMGRFD